MDDLGIAGLAILAVTFLASYHGFKNPQYYDRYLFRVNDIRYGKQYHRLISSGFLHAGWWHLLINACTFYCFSSGIEDSVGVGNYLLIYFGSLVGGNLFSLFLHRHDSEYSAVGASGAITGLVFATIALYPGIRVGLLGVYLPGWLYGLLYVLYSATGITTRRDNIGHDAHLGGGIVGLLAAVAMFPELLRLNYGPIAALLLPTVAFVYLLLKKPQALLVGNIFGAAPEYQTLDDRYQARKRQQEAELDQLLDKISRQGLNSLSVREKKELEKLSK
ncbi:rhomboid family protein [Hymenobacter cellulosivorans]|uniref:Rhomboid family intramembrane serine protease n=1 Tax=Hymenobacter cellulosivorans TaxID=2932249 RepID=A0ABY4F5W4_9BACT|nr:rhomboid family intramembrane serine protease [Hymenobacter cellulosivorans]UOQ51507.1 rhomboid family intramembrane serine protease [Hymenobacter cellulosivorans]